jgi:hypothetical protein
VSFDELLREAIREAIRDELRAAPALYFERSSGGQG